MKKKIIIAILGLCLLMAIHVLINIFLLHREMEKTMMIMPIFTVIYIGYIQIVIRKYLKL